MLVKRPSAAKAGFMLDVNYGTTEVVPIPGCEFPQPAKARLEIVPFRRCEFLQPAKARR